MKLKRHKMSLEDRSKLTQLVKLKNELKKCPEGKEQEIERLSDEIVKLYIEAHGGRYCSGYREL